MNISDITIGLALLAGLASFLSPCVLALVPVYVSYLSGRAAGGEGGDKGRLVTFMHGVAFVLGFSVVFILFQIIGFGLGRIFYDFQFWLARIGGFIILIFGLHMIGVFRIPFLEYDIRVHQQQPGQRLGYFSSALMGVFFSAGWSPCIGPVLTLIIALSAQSGSLWKAVGLGAAYSAGLAIPFLVAALGIGWVTVILRRYSKVMRYTEIVMGIVMVIVGIMMMFGVFNLLATMFPGWTPEI
jgi:cytochrome c-type biogenesis protein